MGGSARYKAMAVLVMRGGARVPRVVNTAQPATWAGRNKGPRIRFNNGFSNKPYKEL
ncbi:pleckstrin homology domain-containing family H member 3 [Panicum miliaceum]|uniref:Pleckstrin homology domain-containing family H member 3 n=1 Tax=Panicum miliaceum TaxID=4540 RepID=A0A3L6Q8D0_PANMI|nr:pleckstrin homology domain-containing family H member 3 [Panicum miliaceum]